MSEERNGAIVYKQPNSTAASAALSDIARSRILARQIFDVGALSGALIPESIGNRFAQWPRPVQETVPDTRLATTRRRILGVLVIASLVILAGTLPFLSIGTPDLDAFLPLAAALQSAQFPALRQWGLLVVANDRLFGPGSGAARTRLMQQRERDASLATLEAAIASIAHEVRQPLSTIATRADASLRFLERGLMDLERVRSNLAAIVEESHRASEVFDNVRALFSSTDLEQQAIDINQIAVGALRILREELEERGVTTHTELSPGLPLILGHSGQIQEVILNLVHNAVEAMDTIKEGRRVLVVRTERHDQDAIALAIEDSGPGIDPAKLESIFDPFVTTKPRGTGLGLAICRMTIERHGGQLSASPGMMGALFQFVLPVRLTASATAAEFPAL
ncbi:MAG: ATP-binding protein [Xanthobacteraceae bacterium]|nr:ATP-binding protein [Xanthobacteraceae bacterium]